MAKLKKLIKTLEAAGWAEVAETSTAIQLRHPARRQRLTLSRGKAQVPKPVAQRLLAQAGLNAELDTGGTEE